MPLFALVVVTAIWGITFIQVKDAALNGGTQGSPVDPLLLTPCVPTSTWAPVGQSPAPPTDSDPRPTARRLVR
jgi:hypothetical protein